MSEARTADAPPPAVGAVRIPGTTLGSPLPPGGLCPNTSVPSLHGGRDFLGVPPN
ncbi:hypothetical protein [Stetteria hydrogenophila]